MKKINTWVIIVASIVSVVLLEFSPVRAQESYRGEVSAGYYNFKDDDDFKVKTYGVGGAVYLSEVATEGHPLVEAAFLERIGFVGAVLEKIEFEEGSILKADGSAFAVRATYSKPEFPIALHAALAKLSYEFDPPVGFDVESDS